MHAVSRGGRGAENSRPRILMVSAGIVLFVIGFLLTIAAMQQDNPSSASHEPFLTGNGESSSGAPQEIVLIAGMSVSLAGVILATVGPALGLMKKA